MIRQIVRRPLLLLALVWVAVLVVASVFAPVLAPHPPDGQDLLNALQGPSREHPLGTGVLGLDVLSRLMYGGRTTLLSTVISVATYAAIGVPLGLLAGFRGGLVDALLRRMADLAYAMPAAVLVLVVLTIRPGDETLAMIAMGIVVSPSLARVVRASVLSLRERLYVRIAVVSGLAEARILWRHVLPGVASTVIVHIALFGTAAVGLETGLGFLGLGTTEVSWGTLVSEASTNIGRHSWLLVPSGALIISFVLALGLIGDGVRDLTAERHGGAAPRTRRRRGAPTARPAALPATRDVVDARVATDHQGTAGALAEVEGLTIGFDGPDGMQQVLSDVGFTVARDEIVGLVGESGSGKSITAMALVGLLPGTGRVLSGTMRFDGRTYDLTMPETLRKLRGRIAVISQDPIASLDPCYRVRQQLDELLRLHQRLDRHQRDQRVLELLTQVRLARPEEVADSYPHQLSGGMAQRVSIALALASDPVLVLADEPTTALDVTVQAEILDLLSDLDVAVLFVTHNWGALIDICDRALVMYAGQVVEAGPIADIAGRPGHPYTAGLLRSNPWLAARGEELPAIPGNVIRPADWPVGCRFANRCPVADEACSAAPVPAFVRPDGAGVTRCVHPDRVPAMLSAVASATGAPMASAMGRADT